jgi:hypothetical protein
VDSIARPRLVHLLPLFAVLLALTFTGCEPSHRERPFGYLRLGPVGNFLKEETFLESDRLLVRHDAGGFSIMSTECTKDLSPLHLEQSPSGERIWKSKYTASSYSYDGKVLTGPAIKDLPYYDLRIDAKVYGGPKDTLYVEIGKERSKEWRLKVP